MTRPMRLGPIRPLGVVLGGDLEEGEGNESHDCCDPTPPPDRAFDAEAFTVNSPDAGGFIQTPVSGAFFGGGVAVTENYGTTPTNGNTLYALLFASDGRTVDSAGWSLLQKGTANGDQVALYTKVAGAAEPTAVHVPAGAGGSVARLVLFEIGGSTDVSDDTDNAGQASPLTGPTLTPSEDPGILIAGFIGAVATYAGDPTWTPQGALLTDSFLRQSPGRLVSWAGHQDTTSGSYTPELATTPLYADPSWDNTASVAVIAGNTPTAVEWNVPAPNTVDGDDGTYHEIDGPDVLRIDLGGIFRIVRARLLIGCEDAGHVTYTIRGALAADFSDAVNLGSVTFDSTGSFTADDIDIAWSTDESYRYFELTGTSETRRVYSFELYEPSVFAGEDHNHDAIEQAIADLAATLDELGASEGFLTAIDGGGDVVATVAAAGSTETIDLTNGNVHDVTLDDDCTFTFTNPAADRARSFTMFLRQDGTGGWVTTWPGTVVWPSGSAPTLSTDPNAVDVLTFVTLDGGIVWYGFATGGAAAVAALDDLTDVVITAAAANDRLAFDGTNWVNSSGIWRPVMDGAGAVVTDGATGEAVMALS